MPPTPFRTRDLAAAVSALSTAVAVHAQPRVIYADAHNTGTHNGATWQTAFRDLQEALYAADNAPERLTQGIEIRIAQGIYTPDHGTLNPSLSFVLNSAVTLMGGFAGLLGANPDERDPTRFVSVLSGDLGHDDGPNFTNYEDNSRTIVLAATPDPSITIDGFEISGGNADNGPPGYVPSQGVISVQGGNPISIGRITIRNCSIVRNRAAQGPVLRLYESAVYSTQIKGNRSQGSALVIARQAAFQSCDIRGNRLVSTSTTYGQPIFSFFAGSSPTTNSFARCLIADNTCGGSAIIYSYEPGVTIAMTNCTFAGNASYLSEPITSGAGPLRLRNCIFSGNIRSSIPTYAVQISAASPALLDVNTTSLIDNGAAGIRFTSSPGSPPLTLSGDPLFVNPSGPDHDASTWADNNYHLRPGSPAIDRADSTDPLFSWSDLDGKPLYDDPNTPNLGIGGITIADLGCYEFDGRLCPADFNASGSLTVADIFDFLNAWLASDPRADFDGSGLSVSDIFAFINAWLQGC